MKITKNIILDWVQLIFMFLPCMLLLGAWGELNSSDPITKKIAGLHSFNCYLPFYNYTGDNGASSQYSTYICFNSNQPSILRIYATDPVSISSNAVFDIISFIFLVLAGFIAWGKYFVSIFKKYRHIFGL